MVIFHCYVSLPEGTWTLLLNQGVLISFTWNLNCSRASGCIYSIYIVFIVCLCVSYWVLTRISMDWPLMIAKIEKTYPHDIPRIFPGYHHHSPSYPIQNSHFPRFSSTKTTSFRPFPWPCGIPMVSLWVAGPGVPGPRQGSMATTSTSMITSERIMEILLSSMDWFKGKSTGKHRFSH